MSVAELGGCRLPQGAASTALLTAVQSVKRDISPVQAQLEVRIVSCSTFTLKHCFLVV